MYIITAFICFLSLGVMEQDLCFNSHIPLHYKSLELCNKNLNNVVAYMDHDLKEREVKIIFKCVEIDGEKKINTYYRTQKKGDFDWKKTDHFHNEQT